ncbi:MAG: hypothetical protein EOM77_00950 [Bacteroidia bacterium]|nr:hypothetical protein [Bacteroidia bacterium]
MDDIKLDNKIDEASGDFDQNAKKKKNKGWPVLYLPAFFIALITIALLLLMIFGTLFGNNQASDSDNALLHAIDFTVSEAAFSTPYSYLPSALEEAEFVVGQGFRWETLNSQIRVEVPTYENDLSLEITFGAFNAKIYDSIIDNQSNFVVSGYSANDTFLASRDVLDINQGVKKTIDVVHDDVSYLLISYVHPITSIGGNEVMGYLYLKTLSLYQTNS